MKLILGKTPEEQAAEEAKKQRELEISIQQSMIERREKIEALHKKQKINKIIILTTFGIVLTTLMVYGTYNTFFKKGLTIPEVEQQVVLPYVTPLYFPAEGLDGYIQNNIQNLFNKYVKLGQGYDYATVDEDSVAVTRVVRANNNKNATVYFSANVNVKQSDIEITDETLKKAILDSGLNYKVDNSTTEEVTTEADTKESKNTKTQTISTTGKKETTKNSDTKENTKANSKEKATTEVTTVATTEEVTTQVDNSIDTAEDTSNTMSYQYGSNDEKQEYYIKGKDVLMQVGPITTEKYYFVLPIQIDTKYDSDGTTAVATGYKLAGEMSLYSLNDVNQTDFSNDVEPNDYYKFNKDAKVDEDTLKAAQIKVDKTLGDLYSKRDTSQDFLNFKTFNTYDATYISLDAFEMYSQDNAMGYNSKVTYTIQTTQGFTYTLDTYLKVEQSGNTYVITKIL